MKAIFKARNDFKGLKLHVRTTQYIIKTGFLHKKNNNFEILHMAPLMLPMLSLCNVKGAMCDHKKISSDREI